MKIADSTRFLTKLTGLIIDFGNRALIMSFNDLAHVMGGQCFPLTEAINVLYVPPQGFQSAFPAALPEVHGVTHSDSGLEFFLVTSYSWCRSTYFYLFLRRWHCLLALKHTLRYSLLSAFHQKFRLRFKGTVRCGMEATQANCLGFRICAAIFIAFFEKFVLCRNTFENVYLWSVLDVHPMYGVLGCFGLMVHSIWKTIAWWLICV